MTFVRRYTTTLLFAFLVLCAVGGFITGLIGLRHVAITVLLAVTYAASAWLFVEDRS